MEGKTEREERRKNINQERERKRRSYVPHSLLSDAKLEETRRQDRIKSKRKYLRKKQRQREGNIDQPSTSKPATRSSANERMITVKLPFSSKKGASAKKRYKTALRAAYRQIQALTSKNQELEQRIKREIKRAQKQKQRFVRKSTEDLDRNSCPGTSTTESQKSTPSNKYTPRTKTKLLLKKECLKLNPRGHVYRQLVFGSTIVESLKGCLKKYKTKSRNTTQLALDIIRKYRCMNTLSCQMGIDRRKVVTMSSQRKNRTIKQKYGQLVITFLEREDNCTILPGKRDTKTVEKVVHQKRVLNDYLHNLYDKFKVENPNVKISKTQFCRLRPPHIVLTCFSSRKTCLCTYHQNFSLKLKTLRTEGINCKANPEAFLKEYPDNESVNHVLTNQLDSNKDVKYKHWKRVQLGDKLRWKEIEEAVNKGTFITTVLDELKLFRQHVERIRNQYTEMRRLRENLPPDEIMVWMDFAENFTCSSPEEVQSAYWSTDMISLHTMVVYSDTGVSSYVAISDVLVHNAIVIYCILGKLIALLKERYQNLKKIHYLTDSPTSQYRNKTMFQILCHHVQDFGVTARWNYLEVGHGKGPCDGLGGSVKRSADMAVRQGKCSIQNAGDFYKWVTSNDASKVKYILYSENDIKQAEELIKSKPAAQAVPGTMKVHAVVPLDECTVATRELSCYCTECFSDVLNTSCAGWTVRSITAKGKDGQEGQDKHPDKTKGDEKSVTEEMVADVPLEMDSWVAALYESHWYIGQITDIDHDEVLINFLTAAGKYRNSYKFPSVKDEIWIQKSDVIVVINSMKATGKSRRFFTLSDEDQDKIEKVFKDRV